VACNTVKYYLEKHFKNELKAVTSAFINGLSVEFDIMIVDKDAGSEEFTDAFDPKSVRAVIKVKRYVGA